jgi:hypothetical protein
MTDEVQPILNRLVTLNSSRLAEMAEIAVALELDGQAEFFIDAAYEMADGGVIIDDFQRAIDLLRVSASKRDNGKLTGKQRQILGLETGRVLLFPRPENAGLFSSGERSIW